MPGEFTKIIKNKQLMLALGTFCIASTGIAASVTSSVFSANQEPLGQIVFEDSQYGLLIKPQLTGLPQGQHGFHIHEKPDCGNKGMSARGHFDPKHTNTHKGPYGDGHLGDLPVLAVDSKGAATVALLAPRLTTKDIQGHAIMIHEGGDNYTDTPPLGGGGARIGCGVIP